MPADYYQVLGVPRNAAVADVRRAYFQFARERHPDRFPEGPERERAHDAFQEVTAAYNTLVNERARAEYDRELERPAPAVPEDIARQACAAGQQQLETRQFQQAVEFFRIAIAHVPGLARAHAGLAQALARSPNAGHEAVHAAEEAIRLEPQKATWHGLLAELLLAQGLRLRARRAAESALALDPEETRALNVMDDLGPSSPDEPSSGGLFGRRRR
jgi:curved DNA-binding protein CbpA